MKIIIAGVGKLGEYLAKLLAQDNEITLIDKSFLGKEGLINNEDVNYVEGNALDCNILTEAGISTADLIICVMKNDSENMICSLLANKLGVKYTIPRIRTPEYLNSINIIKDVLGSSMVINPELLTASHIAQSLNIPSALEATSFLKGRMDVISLRVKENGKLHDTLVENINSKILICAIERGNEIIIPNGKTKLLSGDKIHITGKRKDINSFLKYTKLISEKTKEVIICGGSDVSIYVAYMLDEMGMNVKIIEKDSARSDFLSEKLPNVLIINADVSNQDVLYEEGIKKCDAFLALTSLDEENIIYSMFARSLEVPKVITKVNHIVLDGITKKADIDLVVAPHKIVANQVVQYIRALQNSGSSSCEAIYNFGDDIFEIIEFKVKENFKALDKKIKDVKFKENILIAAIQRGKNIIYPSGKDEIKINDTILIINKDKSLRQLNDILK